MVVTGTIKKGESTKGKLKSLRSTITGTMTPEEIATKDYNVGDLIKGKQNEQTKCTDYGRNG
jgi:hypothetical protein